MKLAYQLHRIPQLVQLHVGIDHDGRRGDHHAHRGEDSHRGRQARQPGPTSLFALAVAETRVKSGMFSESVAQNPIMPVSEGMKIGQNSLEAVKLALLCQAGNRARALSKSPSQAAARS